VTLFGTSLAVMNWSIYQSFARIPIGMAVTLEFIGPLCLAIWGSRRPRDFLWAGLAAVGVALLGLQPGNLTWSGVAFALLAGAAWVAYILLSAQTGRRWPGLDGLALASLVAALLTTPAALGFHRSEFGEIRVLGLGSLVGLLSSVIPYSCELVALRSLRPAVFSILMSLEPAAGALAGLAVLHELLRPLQLLAMVCVIVASLGATSGPGFGGHEDGSPCQ
jgi:inner membrane transporter RhtA